MSHFLGKLRTLVLIFVIATFGFGDVFAGNSMSTASDPAADTHRRMKAQFLRNVNRDFPLRMVVRSTFLVAILEGYPVIESAPTPAQVEDKVIQIQPKIAEMTAHMKTKELQFLSFCYSNPDFVDYVDLFPDLVKLRNAASGEGADTETNAELQKLDQVLVDDEYSYEFDRFLLEKELLPALVANEWNEFWGGILCSVDTPSARRTLWADLGRDRLKKFFYQYYPDVEAMQAVLVCARSAAFEKHEEAVLSQLSGFGFRLPKGWRNGFGLRYYR